MKHGLTWDAIAVNIIFGSICMALTYLLVRTSRGTMLEDSAIEHIDGVSRSRMTWQLLAMTYGTLVLLLLVAIKIELFRNWIGAVSAVMALSMFCSALWELVQARKIGSEPSLQFADEVARRNGRLGRYKNARYWLITSFSLTFSLSLLLFWRFEGQRIISIFDFAALLVLLASYVFWFIAKELSFRKHRGSNAGD